jgi:hypothetical protein
MAGVSVASLAGRLAAPKRDDEVVKTPLWVAGVAIAAVEVVVSVALTVTLA